MGAREALDIEIDERVGVHEQKRSLVLEVTRSMLQSTCCSQKLRLHGQLYRELRGAALERSLHHLRLMVKVDHGFLDAGPSEPSQDILDHRCAEKRQRRFRSMHRQRPQPFARARRQDHGFSKRRRHDFVDGSSGNTMNSGVPGVVSRYSS